MTGENKFLNQETQTSIVIPVVEEQLVVDKVLLETGKVTIHKRVHEEEATINIPIVSEGYEIKHVAKDIVLEFYPPNRQEGDITIIPVVREVLVVEKRYQVIEEIYITKVKTETPFMQQVTLLKEEVKVERTSLNNK